MFNFIMNISIKNKYICQQYNASLDSHHSQYEISLPVH